MTDELDGVLAIDLPDKLKREMGGKGPQGRIPINMKNWHGRLISVFSIVSMCRWSLAGEIGRTQHAAFGSSVRGCHVLEIAFGGYSRPSSKWRHETKHVEAGHLASKYQLWPSLPVNQLLINLLSQLE